MARWTPEPRHSAGHGSAANATDCTIGLGEGEERAIGPERVAGRVLSGLVDRASQRCDPRILPSPAENGIGEPLAVPEHPAGLGERIAQ